MVRSRPSHVRWWTNRPRAGTVHAIMIRALLVPVHCHTLTVPAKFAIGRGRDRAGVASNSRALLEREQLLGAEGFVVDLGGGLDEVLQVSAGEEVAEIDEFAVAFVLDYDLLVAFTVHERTQHTIDDAPLVLAAANVPAVYDNSAL